MEILVTKYCRDCNDYIDVSKFYLDKKKNKLSVYCKIHTQARARKNWHDNLEARHETQRKNYQKNKDKIRGQVSKYKKEHAKEVAIKRMEYERNNPEKVKVWKQRYSDKHKKELSQKQKDRNKKNRDIVFNHYGSYCHCDGCTENRYEFLTIEHIDGRLSDRPWHFRKNGKKAVGPQAIKSIIRHNFPRDITILCMNCNYSKGVNGYCPHERENNGKQELQQG